MDRYRIIKKVGDGTYGQVLKAIAKASGEVSFRVAPRNLRAHHSSHAATLRKSDVARSPPHKCLHTAPSNERLHTLLRTTLNSRWQSSR
jgi:serine/threonine protein kinase